MPLASLSIRCRSRFTDDLVEKGLARRIDSDNYDVHDLVREFLVRSMDDSLKAELHNNAVNGMNRTKTAVEKIEYIHHLNASGDMDTLADVLQEMVETLIRSYRTIRYSQRPGIRWF